MKNSSLPDTYLLISERSPNSSQPLSSFRSKIKFKTTDPCFNQSWKMKTLSTKKHSFHMMVIGKCDENTDELLGSADILMTDFLSHTPQSKQMLKTLKLDKKVVRGENGNPSQLLIRIDSNVTLNLAQQFRQQTTNNVITTSSTPLPNSSTSTPIPNLSTQLVEAFSLLTKNKKDRKHINLKQLVEFGRFVGMAWDVDLTKLKALLFSSGGNSHVEFNNICKVDLSMFVNFCSLKVAAFLEHHHFLTLFSNWSTFWGGSDGFKETLVSLVKIVRRSTERREQDNHPQTLANIDYLQLFHLGRCMKPCFTWDECNEIKLMLGRCDDNAHCRERILLGVLSNLVEGNNDEIISNRARDFLSIVKEYEDRQLVVRPQKQPQTQSQQEQQHHPQPRANQPLPPPPTPKSPQPQQLPVEEITVTTKRRLVQNPPPPPPPKASSKCAHLIRAAFQVLQKDENAGIPPKLLSHFGQFMLKDWVVTANEKGEYTIDGDVVSNSLSEHVFNRFCGRRLSQMEDNIAGECGKAFLSASRSSNWKKKVLDGVLRILLSHSSGKIDTDDLFHFGKCMDVKFKFDDCRRCLTRLELCRTKNIRRSCFEGLFCQYCEAFGIDDGMLRWSVEKYIKSAESGNVLGGVGDNRTASFALLKMDLVQVGRGENDIDIDIVVEREEEGGFEDLKLTSPSIGNISGLENFSCFNNRSSNLANIVETTNNVSTINDKEKSDTEDSDLLSFIDRAKRARQSAQKMRVRDENLKKKHFSQGGSEERSANTVSGRVKLRENMYRFTPTKSNIAKKATERIANKQTKLHIFSPSSCTHRTAAIVIQAAVRRWTCMVEFEVMKQENVGGRGGYCKESGRGVLEGKVSPNFAPLSPPPVPEPLAPAIKHANVNINEHNNVTTEMLLAFALNQLQIRNQHQDQNQDQNKNQQMVINSKRNQNHRPFDHEFQQLQERSEQQELETFEQLKEAKINAERICSELQQFKNQASAHLRAQNLTIKKLSFARARKSRDSTIKHV